jgi:predicted N-acetyltransferase YhbS
VEFRRLRPEELEDWFTHLVSVFALGSSKGGREYFLRHWENDPWKNLEDIFVAVEAGQILSTVRIMPRRIFLAGEEVTMGGIGEVSTKLEWRGTGLSSRLLQMAVEEMERRGIQFSMLFASLTGFYARLGWRELHSRWKVVEVPEEHSRLDRIRPFSLQTDLASIREIYDHYARNFNGPVVRDTEDYWKKWVMGELKNWWVIEDITQQIIAYFGIELEKDELRVKEFGTYPTTTAELFDRAVSVLAHLVGPKVRRIKFDAAIYSRLKVIAWEDNPYKMYRLVTPFTLGEWRITNNQELLTLLSQGEGSNGKSGCLFWAVDAF